MAIFSGIKIGLISVLMLLSLLPVLDLAPTAEWYDFEPHNEREVYIDPRYVEGLDPARYKILPRPPLYKDGKMCENGQDPWTDEELILIDERRQQIMDELIVYDWIPTLNYYWPRQWTQREEDDINVQVDRLFKANCQIKRCTYSRKYMTGICGTHRIQADEVLLIMAAIGLPLFRYFNLQ